MSTSGLDRLTPLDASNLRVEAHGLPMNVAAVAILEGAPLLDPTGELALERVRVAVERRLHLAPRLRQALFTPRFGLGPPLWIDDASFDIREHVHARPVPAPGDEGTLLRLCAELNRPPLDRSRPLWEMWFLTGLADGTVALLIRMHHVVADGIAALALLATFLDPTPDAQGSEAPTWIPRQKPDTSAVFADNVRHRVIAVGAGLTRLGHPGALLRRLDIFVRQVRQIRREGRAPSVSFNRPVGDRHRLTLVRADLESARTVAHAHGAKVNDVVLAAIAGGARALLASRGELKPDLVLKVSVAASTRAPTEEEAPGNSVGIMVVPVPVGEPDPVRRLEDIARSTAERKRLPPYQPSARFAQRWMVRVMFHQRLVNLLASNLAGAPMTLYFAGAKVLEVFQAGVVQGNLTLSVGVLSYAGQLNVDIVGDIDAVPDLTVFATGLREELERLGPGVRRDEVVA
jgi:WS/DGAT/MGAT family acyltransferase